MIDRILSPYIDNESAKASHVYSLEGITSILSALGNPQLDYRVCHIAGTNGKGSTAHMLASILAKAGVPTGLYTSPHLERVNERIRIRGTDIDDDALEASLVDIARAAGSIPGIVPTYFDILTAAAFLSFKRAGISHAVIETGLGGRLDSTNVAAPSCSIITDISYDHGAHLGTTLARIAAEKAGIIKTGSPLVTSNRNTEVLNVLEAVSAERGCEMFVLGRDFTIDNIRERGGSQIFDYTLRRGCSVTMENVVIASPVPSRVRNAALALTAALAGGVIAGIPREALISGLATANVPGRFERLSEAMPVFFDPAHNPAALSEIFSVMRNSFPSRGIVSVMTIMKDKDIAAIRDECARHDFEYAYYPIDDPRCYLPAKGESPWSSVYHSEPSLGAFLKDRLSAGYAVLMTGSFRLYPAARRLAAVL